MPEPVIPKDLTLESQPFNGLTHLERKAAHHHWVLWLDGRTAAAEGRPCEPPEALLEGVNYHQMMAVMAWQRGWLAGQAAKQGGSPR